MIKNLPLLFIAINLLISCNIRTPIDVDTLGEPEKMVINGFINPNDSVGIYLHEVTPVNDYYKAIDNATVSLYENGSFIANLTPAKHGLYFADYKPVYGNNYTITANHIVHKTATVTNYIPRQVYVENINFKRYAGITPWGDNYSEITVTFTDPPQEENFYEILVFSFNDEYYNNNIFFPYTITDPVLLKSGCLDNNSKIAYFTDELIDGKTYNVKMHILANNSMRRDNFKLFLSFKSVSEELYLYHQKMYSHIYNQGGLQLEFLIIDGGNPVTMYSNVDGGYGIFAGYTDELVEIDINAYN